VIVNHTHFAPMLAGPADLDKVQYPLFASPKLDGIRALKRGTLLSRKLLDIPNKHVQALFKDLPEGLDGELIVSDPTAPDVYRKTNSIVMSHDKPIDSLTLHVFDNFLMAAEGYEKRYDTLLAMQAEFNSQVEHLTRKLMTGSSGSVAVLTQTLIKDRDELDEYEKNAVAKGYEGVMLRSLRGRYKFGRSTTNEGILLKLKRFEDSEAEIVRIEEEMHNANVAERDNLGRTKRSSAKDGKVGKGTMGALVVRDLKTGVEFNIGTGFTAADRAGTWKPGEIVKYKSFPVGVKDKPRHPVFLGRRSKIDL
jgi:DNA ligase-1